VSNPSASKKATFIAFAITRSASRINECSWPRPKCAGLILVGLFCFLPAASGLADDASLREQTAQLQDQLGRLEAREDAKDARAALEQARRALQAATGPIEDAATMVRAQQIARAAMTLAERQLERRKAQTGLIEAQRRLRLMQERASSQRRALEALMRERASAAHGAKQP
jgi:chromatin segregation and condensation protein Rec8/ScpA/Scc1 (kleisin family)